MNPLYYLFFIPFFCACSSGTNFGSEDKTNVVITKNPKGNSGGSTETRQIEFNAPWLSSSSEMFLELASVSVFDGAADREIVGTIDAGVYVSLKKSVTGKIVFSASREQLAKTKFLEFKLKSAIVKTAGKKDIPLVGIDSLSFEYDYSKQSSNSTTVSVYLSSSYSSSRNECSLLPTLSASASQGKFAAQCGADSDSPSASGGRDGDDNDDDDDDDDKDYKDDKK